MVPHLALALWMVEHLKQEENTFGEGQAFVSSDGTRARTRCSSFITVLLNRAYEIHPLIWASYFNRDSPFARDYHNAILSGVVPQVDNLEDVRPGDLVSIAYEEDRNDPHGFTGHSAIVADRPWKTSEMVGEGQVNWAVPVLDSSRTSHGPGDTRFTAHGEVGGIGIGTMRVRATVEGVPLGYNWSLRSASEYLPNGRGQTLRIGRFPIQDWPAQALPG